MTGDHCMNRSTSGNGVRSPCGFLEPPPITPEERAANLSMLENHLNAQMKCFAGRNKVYVRALILAAGTTRPRIALKCRLRADYGLNSHVYYEFIRDVCCTDPSRCEAVQRFMVEREQ